MPLVIKPISFACAAERLAGTRTCPNGPIIIPSGTAKSKRQKLHLTPYLKRGDIDNIIKAVLDALNGYAYKDDSAVFSVCGRKFYTDGEPLTVVTISSVEVDHEL